MLSSTSEMFFFLIFLIKNDDVARRRQALHLGCLATIGYVIVMTASPKISHR